MRSAPQRGPGNPRGQKVNLMFEEGHRCSFLVESYRSVGATPKSERTPRKQRRRKSGRIDQVYLNEDPTSSISGKNITVSERRSAISVSNRVGRSPSAAASDANPWVGGVSNQDLCERGKLRHVQRFLQEGCRMFFWCQFPGGRFLETHPTLSQPPHA